MRKILIIDDDARNIFALKAVLRAKGYECLTAQSAGEGISLMQTESGIGIVLMDMMMPDMDGYEAIGRVKAHNGASRLPVIAVTAQAMPGDRERALEAGADNYISKPIHVEALLDILQGYLGRPS